MAGAISGDYILAFDNGAAPLALRTLSPLAEEGADAGTSTPRIGVGDLVQRWDLMVNADMLEIMDSAPG